MYHLRDNGYSQFTLTIDCALTCCRLNELCHTIDWKILISIWGMSDYLIKMFLEKMVKLFENSGDPDQKPHSAASDLGLHCLPVTLLGISRLQ